MRVVSSILAVALVVAVGALLWGFREYRADVSELIQYFNGLTPAAVTLHHEHFQQDSAPLHVLWWKQDRKHVPDLKVHHLWIEDEKNEVPLSGHGLRKVMQDYNRISLAQACYLVQRGERSARLESIFDLARVSYLRESVARKCL